MTINNGNQPMAADGDQPMADASSAVSVSPSPVQKLAKIVGVIFQKVNNDLDQ